MQGRDSNADTENEHADTGQGREAGRDRRLGSQYRLPRVQSRQLVGLLRTAGSSARVGSTVYHRELSPSGPAVYHRELSLSGACCLPQGAQLEWACCYHRELSPMLCDDLGGWDLGECGRRSGREGIYLYI